MSAGAEREPLTQTLSVEEGRTARRLDSFDDDFGNQPRMSVTEAANKYAGLAVCVAAIVVAICALSGVAMIGSMHARLTPEAVADAAATRLLGSSTTGSAMHGGIESKMSLWPEHSWMDLMANFMQINWSPMFNKLAATWKANAQVYQDVAEDLAANADSQTDMMAIMANTVMLEAVAGFSTSLKTASEAARMMGSLKPPAKEAEVSITEFAKDASVLDYIFGLNGIQDEDGDASVPLAGYLQNAFDPHSVKHFAEACVQLVERVQPSAWAMHTYTTSDIGVDGQCMQPESFDLLSMPNPLTGEPLSDELPSGGEADDSSPDYDCSQLGSSQVCMCDSEVHLEEEAQSLEGIQTYCQQLAHLMAKHMED
mmetsp:Transcript_25277/g.63719  ORF Transcript_25277/g.63719 Transcript_25277/m.63719 type:complete len:369 (+) Transcript_25277:94-1200(+)|eukprot:jgi/Tetstr1/431785/TSEL_021281.t1